jgi:alpha-glucosidase (family GH31 glycosyl hydrolase)
MKHLGPPHLVALLSLLVVIGVTLALLLPGAKSCHDVTPPLTPSLESPPWPMWVHRHWVWENSGTENSAYTLVNDYLQRDVPVGAVILDRPWETECNTFIPDPNLYPNLASYVDRFHQLGVKVFMWITSVVNVGASNFQEGVANNYFLSNGATINWWGGEGALLDYTNPSAVEWWHRQMDPILDMDIDGWKCDATDPYVMLMTPPARGAAGHVSWEQYKDMYYRDFFEYTREKLGKNRVITARPCDDWVGASAPVTFAPVDVNFAGWVGDQDPDWTGIRTALNNMFASARLNYVSYGSDIGGFRGNDHPDREVFIRWAQLGALCPVMENGGGGEHRPWKIDDEILSIYRKFAYFHHQLIPYIYSQAALSYEHGIATMRIQDGAFTYMLGDALLVAPFYNPGQTRTVRFPTGEWLYFFDETKTYTSGEQNLDFPLAEFPLFVKKGSIIPLWIENDAMPYGSAQFKGYTTVFIYPGADSEKEFGLYEEDRLGTLLSYRLTGTGLTFYATPTERSLILRIYGDHPARQISLGSGQVIPAVSSRDAMFGQPQAWYQEGKTIWVMIGPAVSGVTLDIQYAD